MTGSFVGRRNQYIQLVKFLYVINLLQDKKDELEQLREMKMKGIVRSRVQWLQHGQKPSKLFCSLENKHFTEKTVK